MDGYVEKVLHTLLEQKDQREPNLNWAGSGAVLELFHKTSGASRQELIRAIGQIIQGHRAPAAAIAQLIQIASSLDLSEIEPNVRALELEPFGSEEPVKGAIGNYLAFRKLQIPAQKPSTDDAENVQHLAMPLE